MKSADKKQLSALTGQHAIAIGKHDELQAQLRTALDALQKVHDQLKVLQDQIKLNRAYATKLQRKIDALQNPAPKK